MEALNEHVHQTTKQSSTTKCVLVADAYLNRLYYQPLFFQGADNEKANVDIATSQRNPLGKPPGQMTE